MKVKRYNDFLATLVFLEYHPLVNEEILDYALPQALVKRRETSFDALNPIEVNLVMTGPLKVRDDFRGSFLAFSLVSLWQI